MIGQQYNAALVIVLVVFLIFACGVGRSLGTLYCAKNEKAYQDAQLMLLFNLLFAGLFGWWAYYEYKRCEHLNVLLVVQSRKIALDPNIKQSILNERSTQKDEDMSIPQSALNAQSQLNQRIEG